MSDYYKVSDLHKDVLKGRDEYVTLIPVTNIDQVVYPGHWHM
jgi:hypothetical protein